MKAAYYFGDRTIRVDDGKSIPPASGEVRIDVAYCGICGTDIHIYHGAMDKRVALPQIMGHEMSGVIAEVGEGVKGFARGEAVVVRPLDNRGETLADRGFGHICRGLKFMGIDSPGAFQSSWTVPAFTLHKVPQGVDLKLAAFVEPLAVACHDVRLGAVKDGELAVVLGGGPIGILVALVARAAGAQVILSEVNQHRRKLAAELGFQAVNPLDTNLPQLCLELSGGTGADIVFEVSGAKAAVLSMTDMLAIRGRMVVVAIHPQPVEVNLFQFFWKELQMRGARVYEPEDYEEALAMIAQGNLPLEKLITRICTLDELPEAFQSLEGNSEAMKILADCRS